MPIKNEHMHTPVEDNCKQKKIKWVKQFCPKHQLDVVYSIIMKY